ncbi:MAG: DUF2191 domain-containing protein [Verrucomicrobia bacterium]|nr:DUF2191 domain-containing protein [Verrucomicrobiota bacterium]
MRTTLTIDDDIAQSVENLRNRKNLSLRDAINQLLRAGLQAVEKRSSSRPYHGPVFSLGELKPGIDPNRMNQLADELEAEQYIP